MTVDEAIKHYRTATNLARELGLGGPAAISNWRSRNGGTVPELYARRLHEMTKGRLKFDRQTYGLDS